MVRLLVGTALLVALASVCARPAEAQSPRPRPDPHRPKVAPLVRPLPPRPVVPSGYIMSPRPNAPVVRPTSVRPLTPSGYIMGPHPAAGRLSPSEEGWKVLRGKTVRPVGDPNLGR